MKGIKRWYKHTSPPSSPTTRIMEQVITAVLILLATSVVIGIGRWLSQTLADEPERVPPVEFRRLLGAELRVRDVRYVDIDGVGTSEAIVSTVGNQDELGVDPGNVLILAFDEHTQRWDVVFDANSSPEDDESPTPDQNSIDYFEVFPKGAQLENLQILSVPNPQSKTLDVAMSANPTFGVRPVQRLAIVHFENQVASIAYRFTGTGSGSIRLINKRLTVTSQFHTLDDSGCCPLRDYDFRLAPRREFDYTSYEVVEDDRPWLGTWIRQYTATNESMQEETLNIVLAVSPRSPARRVLLPGDEIKKVLQPLPKLPEGMEESLFHRIGILKPGQEVWLLIDRGGYERQEKIQLISRMETMKAREPRSWPTGHRSERTLRKTVRTSFRCWG